MCTVVVHVKLSPSCSNLIRALQKRTIYKEEHVLDSSGIHRSMLTVEAICFSIGRSSAGNHRSKIKFSRHDWPHNSLYLRVGVVSRPRTEGYN